MSQIVIDGFSTNMDASSVSSWADARSSSVADTTVDYAGEAACAHESGPAWAVDRSIMQFPTASLAGLTILSLGIELFVRYPEDIRNSTTHITDKGTVSGTFPFAVDQFPLVGDTSYGSRHFDTGSGDQWYLIDLSEAAIASLNLSGDTILCAREEHDLNDDEPGVDDTIPLRVFWSVDDPPSSGCRLVVTVDDTPPPPPPPPETGPIDKTLYLDWTGSAPSATHNWCPNWTTPATSMALSRRSDGSLAVLFGTCDGTGRILRLDSSLHNDDHEAIESFYQTAFGGGPSGRNSFQYLTSSAKGEGQLDMTAVKPDGVTEVGLKNRGLEDEPLGDQEWSGLRVNGERIAWRFGTNAVDAWWKMRKLVAYLVPSAWSRTRGGTR